MHLHLCLRNRTYRREIDPLEAEGGVLHAPYERRMIERAAETMSSEIDLRLSAIDRGAAVYQGRGHHACLEARGDPVAVLDG
jgi:hypothetical protein